MDCARKAGREGTLLAHPRIEVATGLGAALRRRVVASRRTNGVCQLQTAEQDKASLVACVESPAVQWKGDAR